MNEWISLLWDTKGYFMENATIHKMHHICRMKSNTFLPNFEVLIGKIVPVLLYMSLFHKI